MCHFREYISAIELGDYLRKDMRKCKHNTQNENTNQTRTYLIKYIVKYSSVGHCLYKSDLNFKK